MSLPIAGMRCVKPANKQRRFARGSLAAALTLAVGAAAAVAAPAQPQNFLPPPPPLPDAQHYSRCLAAAKSNPQAAYEDAQTWVSLGGGFPAQHCAAVALVGLKRYAEAATQLQGLASAMMREGPEMRADALEQAGQTWLLGNRPADAKADFDAALALMPKAAELLIDRAEALALEGKFFDAIDDLNAVLDQSPNRVDALVYRASAYRQLGSLDLALDDAERALRLDPNSAPGLLERGNIRRLKDDDAGAKADWQHVVQLAPGTPAAQSAQDNLGRLAAAPASSTPPVANKR